MNENQKAAFIMAQTQMMIAERDVMMAENADREQHGLNPAHGPAQWEEFRKSWESVLGYNAVLLFFRDS